MQLGKLMVMLMESKLELKVQFLKGALCQLLSDYNSNFSALLPPAFCLVATNIGWFWDLGQFQGIQTTGSLHCRENSQ